MANEKTKETKAEEKSEGKKYDGGSIPKASKAAVEAAKEESSS